MWFKETSPGAFAGDRWHPIPSVGLYVPRGKGSFPSVTMMTSVPAVVAGVPEIAIFTPPAPDGTMDAGVLVAARTVGVAASTRSAAARRSPPRPTAPRRYARWRRSSGRAARGSSPPSGSSPTSSMSACPPGRRRRSSSPTTASTAASPALDLLIEAEHGPDSSAYLVTREPQGGRGRRWPRCPATGRR